MFLFIKKERCKIKKAKIPLKMKKRELTLLIISMIVLALFFSGYSLGKEYNTTYVQTNAKIAEPVLIVENNPVIEIDGKKQKEYYSFNVKNYKENGELTEIDLDYTIEILTKTQEAISFKLWRDNQEIPLKDNKTETIRLTKENQQKHSYKLEILYDKTKTKNIEEIIQDVQIKVHSEQIKT